MRLNGNGVEVELVGQIMYVVEVAPTEGTKMAALDPTAAGSEMVVTRAGKQRESLILMVHLQVQVPGHQPARVDSVSRGITADSHL